MDAGRLMGTAPSLHEECWLLLPWLANGRLAAAQRALVEEHVAACAECAREVARERLMCEALTQPERVTYAPGPSFRKLLERIDGRAAAVRTTAGARAAAPARRTLRPAVSAWRPLGLAWAASVVLVAGLAALTATTWRWSQPLYATYTSSAATSAEVLHIAFVPSVSVGEAGQLLHSAGARVVEGPDSVGIFGIAPAAPASPDGAGARLHQQLSELAQRLRADPRVRWVEPLAAAAAVTNPERRPPPP
jgi:anti-sigma factor RsiW